MRSTAFYVTFVLVVAGVLFASLMAESLGFFERRPAAPANRGASAAGRYDRAETLPAAARAASPKREASPPAPDRAALAGGYAASTADLEAQVRGLRRENQDLKDRLVAVLNWILVNFKGRYPLPESFMGRLNVPAVTEGFTLHPEAAELLRITPDEEQKINDALAYAWEYMAEIEAAIIQVTNPRPDKVVLHIPTFAENGGVLKEDLYAALEITLGRNRFDRFLKTSGTDLEANFSRFGEASRTMVFELAYGQRGEAPQLKIKDGWVVELEPGVRQVTATESTVSNLPPKYTAYLAWLPEYVAAYAER